jgi:hypothetical protein
MHHTLMHLAPVQLNGRVVYSWRLNSAAYMRSCMKSAPKPELRSDIAARASQAQPVFGD